MAKDLSSESDRAMSIYTDFYISYLETAPATRHYAQLGRRNTSAKAAAFLEL